MNISQIEAREKELRARAEDIAARAKDCERKGNPAWMTKSIDRDMAEWRVEWDQVADERKKYEAGQAFMTKMGGNPAGQKGFDSAQVENKAVGHAPSPLDISVDDYKGLWEATKKRLLSFRVETKGPFGESNFVSGGLPPALLPQQTLGLPYEPDRAFNHFKVQTAPNASAVEYLQHTGNANPAAAVAELGTKPDLGMEWTTITTSFTKIAALASFSMEALQDFDYFQQIVPHELFAAIINAETDEVVNGSGS